MCRAGAALRASVGGPLFIFISLIIIEHGCTACSIAPDVHMLGMQPSSPAVQQPRQKSTSSWKPFRLSTHIISTVFIFTDIRYPSKEKEFTGRETWINDQPIHDQEVGHHLKRAWASLIAARVCLSQGHSTEPGRTDGVTASAKDHQVWSDCNLSLVLWQAVTVDCFLFTKHCTSRKLTLAPPF